MFDFNRDDWEGPIPPEHHPMVPPEIRERLAEAKRQKDLELEGKRVARRKRLPPYLLTLLLGAVLCWAYASELSSLTSTIWTWIISMI